MRFIVFFCLCFASYSNFSNETPILVESQRIRPEKKLGFHYGSTSLNKNDLSKVQHMDDLTQKLPGLTAAGGTSRSRFFQLRGIGERSSYEGMPNESVTILIDNIDYTGFGGVLDTFGIETLEVYKGPQNTVMGPSSLAGTIRAVTADKKNKSQGVQLTGESFDGHSLGSLNIMNFGAFNWTGSTLIRKSDGYFTNAYLGRNDTNFKEELFHRSKFEGKNLEVNLHYFELNSGYDVFNLSNSKITQSEDSGRDDQRTLGLSLIYDLKFKKAELKSIFSGHRTESFYSYDEDWGNSSGYDYRIGFTKNLNNFNVEERLLWGGESLFHTTGVFFKNNHMSSRELGFNAEAPRKDLKATFKRRRVAIYHESEWLATKGFSYFVGLRGSNVNSRYQDSNGINVSPEESLWGGHIGLKRESSSLDWSLRLSRGFKAGGINIGTNIDNQRREFSSESLYSFDYVMETKSNTLKSMTNLFVAYRNNVQVKTSFQDNPSDPSSFTFYTDNATTGYSYGVEGSLSFEGLPIYRPEVSYNIMDTRYGNYRYGTRNLKDREFAYAPNYKINIGHNFELNSRYSFLIENIFVDEFYFGNSHNEKAPRSLVTNLSARVILGDVSVRGYINNIFNERTETRGFFFGNRPPNYNDERFVQVGPPRIVGLTLASSW